LKKYLVPVAWALWGIVLLALVWAFMGELFNPTETPEFSSGFGAAVLGLFLVVHAGLGLCLFWVCRRSSSGGLIALTLLLGYPVVMMIAIPLVGFWETRQLERELSRVGDFPDPAARVLAESIESGDVAGLQRLIAGDPPPPARDRAGNDLLAYAALIVRDRDGDPGVVRILLEAGMDPRQSSMGDGRSLLRFMVLDRDPSSIEVVRLLLEHGADPNAVDPQTGMTPMADAGATPEMVRLLTEAGADIDRRLPGGESMLVRFIGRQHWDSALYLIQQGADLDPTDPDGLSVDYYLKEFEDSVYGAHPEGWDRVRDEIELRRNSPSPGAARTAEPR
jgi:hypothetical protein